MTASTRTAARRLTRRTWHLPHEPTGRMQRLLGPLYVTGTFWWRIVSLGARWLPDIGVRACAWTLAALSFVVARRVRRGVVQNLDVVLGPAGWREQQRRIWRTFHEFALCVFDRYTLFRDTSRLRVHFEGGDNWQAALDCGTGFLFITAHYGNMDVGPLMPGGLRRHMHVVREPSVDPRSQRLIEKHYRQQDGRGFSIHFTGDGAGLGTAMLFALRRGEVVAATCDQPREGQPYETADMFGRQTPMSPGLVALARAAGVPMVPVFAMRLGRLRYRVIVREPVRVPRTEDRTGDVRRGLQALADQLEWAIRESPHSWNCWWPRWSTLASAGREEDPGRHEPSPSSRG
ncbi:MAG: lysophospholipid acyltransferase family protein [Planctomycetes bacterium]|nr:lysophospholipid acyltransferase family protein [Planctomycetota bacterium]